MLYSTTLLTFIYVGNKNQTIHNHGNYGSCADIERENEKWKLEPDEMNFDFHSNFSEILMEEKQDAWQHHNSQEIKSA